MLAYTNAIGLTSVKEGLVPAIALVTKEGKRIDVTSPRNKLKGQKGTTDSGKSVDLVRENIVAVTTNEFGESAGPAAEVLSRLLRPANLETPTEEVVDFVHTDMDVSEDHLAIIKGINGMEFSLKQMGLDILLELKEKSKEYETMDQFMKQDPTVKALLGFQPKSLYLRKSNEQGRSRGRQDSLRKILDNLEDLPDTIHFNYESAINQRIHVMQTVLDFQGDKYISRQILTGKTHTVSGEVEKAVLIENIAEEGGLTIEEVTNPTGPLAEFINDPGKMMAEDAIFAAEILGIDNPFKALSIMSAIITLMN